MTVAGGIIQPSGKFYKWIFVYFIYHYTEFYTKLNLMILCCYFTAGTSVGKYVTTFNFSHFTIYNKKTHYFNHRLWSINDQHFVCFSITGGAGVVAPSGGKSILFFLHLNSIWSINILTICCSIYSKCIFCMSRHYLYSVIYISLYELPYFTQDINLFSLSCV